MITALIIKTMLSVADNVKDPLFSILFYTLTLIGITLDISIIRFIWGL